MLATVLPGAALIAGLALAGQAPAGTPAPAANPIADRFREFVAEADPQVAATQEWLLIRAGRAIGDWATVHSNAEALARKRPDSPDACGAVAAGLAGLGRIPEAIAALGKAVELQPSRVQAWVMLAQLHFVTGDVRAASDALERVRVLVPDDVGLLMTLAAALMRIERYERAAQVYEQVTGVAPANPEAWSGLAAASAKVGKLDRVWVAYNQLRLRDPGVAGAVAAGLPAEWRAALPTPIPPTPRPTPRNDTPRLVMGAAPAAGQPGAGRAVGVWNQAALNFEARIAAIGQRGKPILEMMERYEAMCRGARPSSGGTGGDTPPEGGEGQATASPHGTPPAGYYDWATINARSAAWIEASEKETMVECRSLATDIAVEVASVRAEVEKTVADTAGTGLAEIDRKRVLEKYGFTW